MKKQLLFLLATFTLVGCQNVAESTAEKRYHELESKIDYAPYYLGDNCVLVYKEETKLYENDVELVYRVNLMTRDDYKNCFCESNVVNRYVIAKDKIETSSIANH